MKFIYPEVELKKWKDEEGFKLSLETYLRKQGVDNKWYFWKVSMRYLNPNVEKCIQSFYTLVYKSMILGIIDTTPIFELDGYEMFKLDDNQQTELERLKEIEDKVLNP